MHIYNEPSSARAKAEPLYKPTSSWLGQAGPSLSLAHETIEPNLKLSPAKSFVSQLSLFTPLES